MDNSELKLEPLSYHLELRDYLKTQERELWDWFASARAQADYTEHLRLELLKVTYRLDPESHPELYERVETVKERLKLDIPVTLYQAQNSPQSNAALYFIPNEGHIVFSGQVLTLLNADELQAILGHELAHYHLWRREEGEFHIADRLIEAVASDPRASACHIQTARHYQLYTEIFADRGALCAGDLQQVVAGLVKVQTGISTVSGASYLKQAEEIFAKSKATTEGLSHPEAFIRARALALWQESGEQASAQISAMIEGTGGLQELDLLGQTRLTAATRQLLEHFLQPQWFQTPAVLGHAKLFFPDFQPAAAANLQCMESFNSSDPKLREYLCYLLLDFVIADPDLDEMPLAAALVLCQQMELEVQFDKLAAKELKMKARDLKRIKEKAADMLAKAGVEK